MSIRPSEQLSQEEPRAGEFGLLANGASALWDVAVDESLEQDGGWLLELDGRTNYLVFPLHDLAVIPAAIDFLQRGLDTPEGPDGRLCVKGDDTLKLGTFNNSPVCLIWDDESPLRCFLVVGPNGRSTMRLTLHRDDIEMLLQALHQVAKGLPEEAK